MPQHLAQIVRYLIFVLAVAALAPRAAHADDPINPSDPTQCAWSDDHTDTTPECKIKFHGEYSNPGQSPSRRSKVARSTTISTSTSNCSSYRTLGRQLPHQRRQPPASALIFSPLRP